jgi:hypothetical protein
MSQNIKINWSLPEILFIIFLVLKLTNVIDWSWWWVTSPLWIGAGITLVCLIILLMFKHTYKW